MSEVALVSLKVGECFKTKHNKAKRHLRCIVVEIGAKVCYVQNHMGGCFPMVVTLLPANQITSMWRKVEQISQEEFLRWEREYEVFGEVSDRAKNWGEVSTVDFRLAEVRAWNLKNGGTITGRASHLKLPEPETSS